MTDFSYGRAFVRNIGWVTSAEQKSLQQRRIAIAGLGGVGGSHLLTLARLGIGAFHIGDFDSFDIENFNRQAGASMRSLGRPKVDVLREMVKDINPTLELRTFEQGVSSANLDAFLARRGRVRRWPGLFRVRGASRNICRLRTFGRPGGHRGAARHGRGGPQLHAGENDVRRILPPGGPRGR
jgi:Dinucleotide-utilizing enzymes involved in molybdopterin and thiamine biosynthesis family 1